MDDYTVYALASEIEWAHARDRCTINGRFYRCRGKNARELKRQAVSAEYDPLAATCLAELILSRLASPALKEGEER